MTSEGWQARFDSEEHNIDMREMLADLAASEKTASDEKESHWKWRDACLAAEEQAEKLSVICENLNEQAKKDHAERDKYKEYATSGYCYYRDEWEKAEAERDKLRKCHEAELGVCQEHCDVVAELRVVLANYRMYYDADQEYLASGGDGEKYDMVNAARKRIEALEKEAKNGRT